MNKRPCVFFDRDGIVNQAPPPDLYYVKTLEQFHIRPEFLEALRVVNRKHWAAVIVTSQKGVSRGAMRAEDLDRIHEHLLAVLKGVGLELTGIEVCSDEEGHPMQKPAPGMLLRAAEAHGLDLSRSWMVGDSGRDIDAGKNAGCANTVLVGDAEAEADVRLAGLAELPGMLDEQLESFEEPEQR